MTDTVTGILKRVNKGQYAVRSAERSYRRGPGEITVHPNLVRQFGLIVTPSGRIAVAFAAQPDSGAFADGMKALDRMASLVSDHLDELSAGTCAR